MKQNTVASNLIYTILLIAISLVLYDKRGTYFSVTLPFYYRLRFPLRNYQR